MPLPITPATIIGAFLFGAFSATLAHRRGRSPYKWFLIGFLFGILGLIAVFFAPSKKKKFSPPPIIEAARTPLPAAPAIQGPSDKFWYYLDPAHEQQGPMSRNALTAALNQGKISLSTYVWNEEMTEWKCLQDLVVKKV